MNITEALKIFKGGVPVPHTKRTEECEVITMPVPKTLIFPMVQHLGAPCLPLIKKGDYVKVGQKIGDAESPMAVPVHSSVSGTVKDIRSILYAGGTDVMSVEIESDGLQVVHELVAPPVCTDKKEFLKAIRESGLVGLGGAGFPAAIKLSPPPDKPVDVLIINGAECEPFITSDYREMIDNPLRIIEGAEIIMNFTGIKNAFIGIESNKPKAIEKFCSLLAGNSAIRVVKLPSRYPQGGEKQLIYAITGRIVPAGKLPSEIGALVHNVSTTSFIAQYIKTGMPLIKKKVTVDGSAVREPKNLEVLIGTQLQDVFDFCGGFKEEPHKIIMGGPMMGVAQFSLTNTVVKQTNALLAFNKKDATMAAESVCIKCGKCVEACPMNLAPLFISGCVEKNQVSDTVQYGVNDCIECGCCSFVCPASRHLVQSIRYAKAELRKLAHKAKK
ncbi:MAG: Electron transport complex protein RnfC [Smithella sp. PtaU1.Bin162]|nr:MAG: Electron transport complex protein RnfC [Smithella sp. PtaU1.Bin162]